VDKLARALKRLVPLLGAVHGAGQRSYTLGLEAGLETSRYYQRRRIAIEAHLGTVLGGVYPALAPPNRERVDDLVERLNAMLPAVERVDEEEVRDGNAEEEA
jgi:hypothetical protein